MAAITLIAKSTPRVMMKTRTVSMFISFSFDPRQSENSSLMP
jgi:hypothetical protein